jgi:GT2 family glycosyltransferase
MRFSVLLCTYNRPVLLGHALTALILGTIEKPNQVVVVNGGDERATMVVKSFTEHAAGVNIDLRLVQTANKNLAASRNVGLPYCDGDVIAWTDDDAQVFPDWVTQMKRAHREHPEIGAAGGVVVGMNTDSLIGRIADKTTFAYYDTPRYVRFVAGVNASFKREVILQLGALDETLSRGEDVDYTWRVLKHGYKILYDPAIRVYHYHRPTLRAFLNQHYMYGRAYYLVRKKHPDMYCVYPHRLARAKDVLKALNFFAAAVYEPLQSAARMERASDKILAYPILLANQLAWRGGMVRQRFLVR